MVRTLILNVCFFFTQTVSPKIMNMKKLQKTFHDNKKWPVWHWGGTMYREMLQKSRKGIFDWWKLMIGNSQSKNIFTHFLDAAKMNTAKNAFNAPFWWHSKKDEVNLIHVMGRMHFLSSDLRCNFCLFWQTTDRKVHTF